MFTEVTKRLALGFTPITRGAGDDVQHGPLFPQPLTDFLLLRQQTMQPHDRFCHIIIGEFINGMGIDVHLFQLPHQCMEEGRAIGLTAPLDHFQKGSGKSFPHTKNVMGDEKEIETGTRAPALSVE